MNTMEMVLLLEAGVKPETLKEVEIANQLVAAVRRADKKVMQAADWQQDSGIHQQAIELARKVGRMF